MKNNFEFVWLALCTISVFAQAPKPKTPPVIPLELREKFFKAQAEYQNAATAMQQATQTAQLKNAALQQELEKLKTTCGADYLPNLDKDGEIVCTEKPKAGETPKK